MFKLSQWLAFAFQPLSLDHLRYAMVVDANFELKSLDDIQDSPMYVDDNQALERRFRFISCGLVDVRIRPLPNDGLKKVYRADIEEDSVAQFIHQSVPDYLLNQGGLEFLTSTSESLDVITSAAHLRIARSCLRFTALHDEQGILQHALPYQDRSTKYERIIDMGLVSDLRILELLDYALEFWTDHEALSVAYHSNTDLVEYTRWPSSNIIRASVLKGGFGADRNLLHLVALSGWSVPLEKMLQNIERHSIGPGCRDRRGKTPLMLAAGEGRYDVVEILAKRDDVDVNAANCSSSTRLEVETPLSCAMRSHQDQIAQFLVGLRKFDPNHCTCKGEIPLSWAAEYGHLEIVKILLERHAVRPDVGNNSGTTPLAHAARFGHSEVVAYLLQCDGVDPNSKDDLLETPLFHAARSKNRRTVDLLLQYDNVDINSRNKHSETPLHKAAGSGDLETVALLLRQKDIEADSKCSKGMTPLLVAAKSGEADVVGLLAEREDVSMSHKDGEGANVLFHAAASRSLPAVQRIVQRGDADINSRNKALDSPLLFAARMFWGREVVNYLVQREEIDLNMEDACGRTTLSHVAGHGFTEIVQYLATRRGVYLDSHDNAGRTPLSHCASGGNHDKTLNLLLQCNYVNVNSRDLQGKTPLSWAAAHGNTQNIRLFLQHSEIQADARDNFGDTPLHRLSSTILHGQRIDCLRLLLRRQDINADSRNNKGLTALMYAASLGSLDRLEFLLERNVEVDSEDELGFTALMWAIKACNPDTGSDNANEYSYDERVPMRLSQHSKMDCDLRDRLLAASAPKARSYKSEEEMEKRFGERQMIVESVRQEHRRQRLMTNRKNANDWMEFLSRDGILMLG